MLRIGQNRSRRNSKVVGRKNVVARACQNAIEQLEDRRMLAANGISVHFTSTGNGRTVGLSLAATDLAGVVPLGNFNNVNGVSGGATLNDATGTATTASLSYSSAGSYATVNATTAVAPGDEALNTDFLNSAGATPVSVTVSGVPYAQYDIYVYELDDATPRPQITTLAGGPSFYLNPPAPTGATHIDGNASTPYVYTQGTSRSAGSPTPNADYVLFSKVSSAGFTFTASSPTGNPPNGYVNGFQIVEDLAAPDAPTALTATPGFSQVQLNWVSAGGATSYNVYRSTSTGTETLLQAGVSGTTFY